MRYSNMFVTGCDLNTQWQLPFFVEHYTKYNSTPLMVADFGMTSDMFDYLQTQKIPVLIDESIYGRGWFAKPRTMQLASKKTDRWCWIDTDCQTLGDISGIFDLIETNKLAMVEDKPWSTRRNEKWHNSGVVAGEGIPNILRKWTEDVERNPQVGDQEVLHTMLREGFNRLIHITDLPNKYNWLRLQVLDGDDDPNKLVMHHTGQKGNNEILRLMKK
jgi:hypothetical protein